MRNERIWTPAVAEVIHPNISTEVGYVSVVYADKYEVSLRAKPEMSWRTAATFMITLGVSWVMDNRLAEPVVSFRKWNREMEDMEEEANA